MDDYVREGPVALASKSDGGITRPLPTSASSGTRSEGRVILSVRRLTVRFGPVSALEDIDLEVPAGQLVALAGENGAGKSTLVGCVAGDLAPSRGEILLDGHRVPPRPRAAYRRGIAFVRQRTELCDNLDIAANLFLGHERGRFFFDQTSLQTDALSLLRRLNIPLSDAATSVGMLSGGMRQLLSVAQAMLDGPRLLILDEPTFSLAIKEASQIEELVTALHRQGTTIIMASHDVDQIFRLADRVVVLRHGRIVADLDPRTSHRDDVVALLSRQRVDSSARRQLRRLQGLVDQLTATPSSSSLSLILSSLGAALNNKCLTIHLRDGDVLRCAAALGLPSRLPTNWTEVPYGTLASPVGLAAVSEQVVIDDDVSRSPNWAQLKALAKHGEVESSWAVPVIGTRGLIGVITILRPLKGSPQNDELDLVRLYAGYAASAIERDRLLADLTVRNRALETIRDVLETLAGPIPLAEGLGLALRSLQCGLQADQVLLSTNAHRSGAGEVSFISSRAASEKEAGAAGIEAAGAAGIREEGLGSIESQSGSGSSRARAVTGEETGLTNGETDPLRGMLAAAVASGVCDGKARHVQLSNGPAAVVVTFPTGRGSAALGAKWLAGNRPDGSTSLMEDAAHSLQLALEREEVTLAREEAAALRRSREMQQEFLSRLSHELRTPLTTIRGYASSLLQPDITWDAASQQRFLSSVANESARLGRLVEDLLDFSAIESGIFRLHCDWCNIPLVVDAAVECLPPASRSMVDVACDPGLPPVWADHDRIEQVLLNLIDNALRHNPAGTHVKIKAVAENGTLAVSITDDGGGVPADVAASFFDPSRRRRTPTTGAGLGLSIVSAIVEAHGGRTELRPLSGGATQVMVLLPVEGPPRATGATLAPGTMGATGATVASSATVATPAGP
jgi:signal transduction histidine kinase/ABC-type multidrug transport system ATPase subunit